MLKKTLLALALGAGACLSIGAAGAQEKPKFVYLTQTGIDNTFWQSIKKGMDDACAQFNADCQLIFTTPNGDLQKHLQNLQTVVEQGVDGIVTVIVNDDLYDETIKQAVDKGIPVITANVDDSQGAAGNARLAFVGQDLFQAGYILMQGLYGKIPADQPVHVLLGLSRPGESWAEARIGGAKKYLEEAKAAHPDRQITYEVIDSSNDISVTASRICQYVQGHPETNAYVDAGFWGAGAGECLRDLGIKPGQLHMATFDLVPVVLDEMKKGYVDLTIDQQPYYQGYIPIMQLAMIKKYGLSAFDVNTGKALVEPKDVDQVMKFVEMGVR
ncbi:MAG: sugar ABC transporter substrate-binding protein [Rhizobiales bacterium]|nr:sugar ABC transporter substrate-binding protein [Hyphomicrobiales bacterium]